MQGKRRQFIFGLIGLGCGMILSGIFNLLILLNTTEYKNSITLNVNKITQDELKLGSKSEEKEAPAEELKQDVPMVNRNQDVFEENKILIEKHKADDIGEVEEKEALVTIIIPEEQSATQICELLQEEGIIEDARDFREYISEKKMTTKLKEGTITLRKNMSYNELLDNLMID